MATIITKNSSTASSVPLNTQLVQGELAVNVTDKRLFTENASGTVVELGTNPSTLVTSNTFLAFGRGNTEDMRLTSTGLGIGTSSPAHKLDVNGAIGIGGTKFLSKISGASYWWNNTDATYWVDSTGNTVQMALNASGNLGLGVTPSAWGTASSSKAMQIGTSLSFLSFGSGGQGAHFGGNTYWDGTSWRYLNTTGSVRYEFDNAGSSHKWYTAPSGTAGNAISFTQAMTLDASSNLTVGGAVQLIDTNTSLSVNSSTKEFKLTNAWGAGFFTFSTNGSERARIDSSGNLLVGKTSAVASSGNGCWLSNNGLMSVVGSSSLADTFNYFNSTAGVYRFYVNNSGVINATSTTITAISDQRLKENIQDIDVGLDKIMALKPRKFDWKAGKGKDIRGDRGWIAQEFEQVFPEMITTWKDEPPEGEEPYKAVNADLIPVLVKAIQEQQTQISDQLAIINAQSAALEQLKARLDAANL